ncbi:pyridoxal phosphate-dependent aminotransferase [Singulisphaera acidiphila]|uniref:PLP-dependent enzyme, histidinol-phosphate/aromatic aminotransferase or cobyric acid decarboxylase n=1 Tax=Singulisphaera acidiphila (strain ATCC BAA-1392 / DSM 18658 / VKM B-2454 / MOB10) TaxID=886293 RepID=L0D9R4_SINAD|nr:aminotransferase class I/II-fold pyridoxal phosphate-dependent enzyme [Singulisphaera acidiphila]AGA25982.1 PLP-dependent enzyme, histidinol-phosphate/aromatic aminotransferase or cobyric acid decarboxylase [Singulisphaera acidiphila DSM 18658]
MRPIPHGGNPAEARRRYGLGDRPLIDFSACLNPFGPSPAVINAARAGLDRVGEFPEPGCPRLTERIAEFHGVPIDHVVVGAGTSELISLIAQSLREVLALHAYENGDPAMPVSHLVEPTYGEYRRVSVLNELRIEAWGNHILSWRQDVFPGPAAGVFWTGHPDNPTGRAWDRAVLLPLVDASLGLLTVVDESYLLFLPDEAERTLVQAATSRENLLVLRSFSSIAAIPGLRIGYAVASPDMVVRLKQYQDPWTITPVAEAAALAALDDVDSRQRVVHFLSEETPRLTERLWEIPGLRPAWPDRERPVDAPPAPNWLLVSLSETAWTSTQVHEALARLGFLVRECSDYRGLEVGALLTGPDKLVATQGHLRIAVRTPPENDRLTAALAEVLSSEPPR